MSTGRYTTQLPDGRYILPKEYIEDVHKIENGKTILFITGNPIDKLAYYENVAESHTTPNLIDADRLKQEICAMAIKHGYPVDKVNALEIINNQPIVLAEPIRRGKVVCAERNEYFYVCSICGSRIFNGTYNYCPKCGVKFM